LWNEVSRRTEKAKTYGAGSGTLPKNYRKSIKFKYKKYADIQGSAYDGNNKI
jgi:hypothetical protein